jgi:probable HAF family extracellular repeat protein
MLRDQEIRWNPFFARTEQSTWRMPGRHFLDLAFGVLVILITSCGGTGGGGSSPQTTPNPVPTISSLSPTSATADGPTFTLTVTGTNFLTTSVVNLNGTAEATSFVSSTQITAVIPAIAISSAGTTTVTVTNPSPGGGTSLSANFVVSSPQGSLSVTIMGLPGGAIASVTVTGPNSYSTQLTSSQTLQVTVGAYTVTGNQVGVGSSNYFPSLAFQAVTVSSLNTTSVTVDYSTIIPNTTKVLDSAGMSSLTVSPDGSTITLSTSSPVATSLAAGNVLASVPTSAAPNGLLVKILSVSTSGQTVTASVQQATLEDAIQQATFNFSETLGPGNTTSDVRSNIKLSPRLLVDRLRPKNFAAGAGACAGNSNTIQLPFNVPLAGGGTASLALSGEDDFCPSFNFQLQISSFQLVSMSATVTAGIHTSIGLLDNVQGSFNSTQNLTTFAANPTVVLIGGVPIKIQPTLTPFIGLSGSTAASAYTGLTTDSTLTIGVSYANGAWSPVDTALSPVSVSSATSVDGQLSLKAFAGLQAGVVLDGFVTPNLSGDGYLQFSSSLTGNPCWTLDAGLEANVGINVTILGKSLVNYSSPALNLYSNPVLQATTTCFAPTLRSVTPNMALVMSPQLTVALTGSNFVPDSTANFNGQPLVTTFLDPTDLTAIIPASNLAVDGPFPVTVSSPDNPGGTSDPVTFMVGSVTVSVSPSSAAVKVGTSQQFTATVKGTSDTMVIWSVNGVIGGNSTPGTITQEGVYTAPSNVPIPATVVITATSQASQSVSASASVTITALTYNFVSLDDPNSRDTGAVGINDSGQIVGAADAGAFLYSGGIFSFFSYPGPAEFTNPTGINGSGQIVGWNAVIGAPPSGFLYSGGTFSSIDYPGALTTGAEGINDSGQIVGYYRFNVADPGQGFLYSSGSFSTIDFPGAFSTMAYGISDNGQIVGSYHTTAAGFDHGFLYSGGSFSSIDFPGALDTTADGINNNGQIVGSYLIGSTYHGYTYNSGGSFISIDYPGAKYTNAVGINDSGQIVGYYGDQNSNEHGFIATPNQ